MTVGSYGSGVRLHRRAGVQTLYHSHARYKCCASLDDFCSTSATISVAMLGGRDCLLGWKCYAVTSETIRLSK